MNVSPILRLLALALVASSCRLSSDVGFVGVFSPGSAARIEITTTTVAGGHAMIVVERIDSTRAAYETSSCAQSIVGGSCEPAGTPVVRPLTQAQVEQLFGVVASAEFRAVRPAYARTGNITPPDLMQVKLDVTVGERSRTIRWERDAVIPKVLNDLWCRVSVAGGFFGLCVETS